VFTLSEVFGTLEAIEKGIGNRNNLDQVENAKIRRILGRLPDGLLEILGKKVAKKRRPNSQHHTSPKE